MRALAVIAVMVYHANNSWLPGGFIGVEVFFVISGYLITLLLIGEHERSGRVHLGQFYLRRARRLLPALFMMLALVIVYTALFKREELGRLRGDVLAALGYVSNWYQIWVGQGYTAEGQFAPLRHLWSLAVEEQFYLVWPIVMIALIRVGKGRLPSYSRWLLLAAVAISVAVGLLFEPARAIDPATTPDAFWDVGGHAVDKTETLYLSTITRSTGLLVGAALAMLWRPVAVMRGPLRNKGRALDGLALVGIGSLLVLAWRLHIVTDQGADPLLFRGGFLAVDLAAMLMIAAVSHRRSFTGRLLGMPAAAVDRHPVVRDVPVPLADLPDDPRRRRQPARRAPVRRGDGRHGRRHGVVLPPLRDADPPPPHPSDHRSPRPARRPDRPAGDRLRDRRQRRARRLRQRQHGHRRARAERHRAVAAARRECGDRPRRGACVARRRSCRSRPRSW